MENKRVYLDNSATTAVREEAIKEMQPFPALNAAREKIASLINSDAGEIFFTGCGTEADNIALFGIVNASGKKGHIISTKIEHHAVLYSCRQLEKMGFEVTYLNVDKNGVISVEELKKAVRDNTLLVSVMHANNEVGSIQPLEEIGAALKEINKDRNDKIYFHSDCVQSAGKLNIDV